MQLRVKILRTNKRGELKLESGRQEFTENHINEFI